MAENSCPQCGAPNPIDAAECKYCGEALAKVSVPQQSYNNQQAPNNQQPYNNPQFNNNFPPNPGYQAPPPAYVNNVYMNNGINPSWPIKSKITAGVLAILLGTFGIHKFYLGKTGTGVLYLLLSWTGITSILGVIEGIIYLTSSDHNFCVKNQVRLQ